MRWVTAARVVAEALAFASVVVLARLVPPAEFGWAAVALATYEVARSLLAQGFGSPLIQRPVLERGHVEAAAFMSGACGFALAAATFLLARPAGAPLFGERAATMVELVSPVFLFAGVAAVPLAELQRRLDFRRVTLVETSALFPGSITAIACAIAGLEGEALVLGVVSTSAAVCALALALGPRTRPRWRFRELREILGFGLPSGLSSLLYTGTRNVDYVILAARLSAAQVGFYVQAFKLAVDYQAKLSGIMLRIAFPVFSRSATRAELRSLRRRITRAHVTLLFPVLGTLIATAPVLVPWMLGERWSPAVAPTQILCVAGMAAVVVTGTGPLLLAVGRPRALLAYNLGEFVGYALVVLLTASGGLVAVCLGVAGVKLLSMLALQYLLVERLVGIPLREVFGGDVMPGGLSCAALLAVGWPLAEVMAEARLPAVLTLLVAISAGALAYLLTLRRVSPAAWGDLRLIARRLGAVVPRTGLARPQARSADRHP